MLNEGRSNVTYRLEGMVRSLVNNYVIDDKTFKVSAVIGKEDATRIFGHTLSEKEMNKLNGHDGFVALFVDETYGPKDKVSVELRKDMVKQRDSHRERAKPVLKSLEKWFGKPAVEVWQGLDTNRNVLGANSIYVCCIYCLDEEWFPPRIV